MTAPRYRFAPLGGDYDLGAFDCGHDGYNRWLTDYAETAVKAGTSGVYLLLEETPERPARVMGCYAIAPTAVVRAELPRAAAGGAPDPVPSFLLAKIALDRTLQGDKDAMWGAQLVVGALRRIVQAANVSVGRVIIVDADNERLLPFYASHSFLPTTVHSLRLYMKVATARKLIEQHETR